MHRQLTRRIEEYLKDQGPSHAIALQGPRGTGKTHYITHELPDALGDEWQVVRMSVLGVSSVREFYDRLADTLLLKRLPTMMPDGVSRLRLLGEIRPMTAKTIIDMMLMPDIVLVFDDIDRIRDKPTATAMTDAIEDIVMVNRQRVILVTDDLTQIPRGIRDRLIWHTFDVTLPPSDIALEVLSPLFETMAGLDLDIDAYASVCEAANASRCTNARDMLRCLPLLKTLIRAPIVTDRTYPMTARRNALTKAIAITLANAMSRRDARSDQRPSDRGWVEDARPDRRLAQWDRFCAEQDIDADNRLHERLDPNRDMTQAEADEVMESIVMRQCHADEDAARTHAILKDLDGLPAMETDEANDLARELTDRLRQGMLDASDLAHAIDTLVILRAIGMPSMTDAEMEDAVGPVIERDEVAAYRELTKDSPATDGIPSYGSELIEGLAERIRRDHTQKTQDTLDAMFDRHTVGVGTELRRLVLEGAPLDMLAIRPELVAKAFVYGNAKDQGAIRDVTDHVKKHGHRYDQGRLIAWLKDLMASLNAYATPEQDLDTMTDLRRAWLADNIREHLQEIDDTYDMMADD